MIPESAKQWDTIPWPIRTYWHTARFLCKSWISAQHRICFRHWLCPSSGVLFRDKAPGFMAQLRKEAQGMRICQVLSRCCTASGTFRWALHGEYWRFRHWRFSPGFYWEPLMNSFSQLCRLDIQLHPRQGAESVQAILNFSDWTWTAFAGFTGCLPGKPDTAKFTATIKECRLLMIKGHKFMKTNTHWWGVDLQGNSGFKAIDECCLLPSSWAPDTTRKSLSSPMSTGTVSK